MIAPMAAQGAAQISAAIDQVVRELYPHVQLIRYDFGHDWSGQWAIFFRVLLSDEASKERNLRDVAPRVVWSVSEKLDLPGLGVFPYFDFRSQAEQARLNEPAWA
jgi:hypothetical protein